METPPLPDAEEKKGEGWGYEETTAVAKESPFVTSDQTLDSQVANLLGDRAENRKKPSKTDHQAKRKSKQRGGVNFKNRASETMFPPPGIASASNSKRKGATGTGEKAVKRTKKTGKSSSGNSDAKAGPSVEAATMNLTDSSSVHDDFLRMFQEAGLSELATEVGILRNGEIPALKEYGNVSSTSTNPEKQKAGPARDEDEGDENKAAETSGAQVSQSSGTQKRSRPSIATGEKSSKGLRHSSMKVMQKVEEKGHTTYNEVADELVAEYTADKALNDKDQQYEAKNIRRRVYDILNVLIAMEIISKDRKTLTWQGMPSNSERDLSILRRERVATLKAIKEKREHLEELLLQQIALKNLIRRNRKAEAKNQLPESQKIPLPFIVINTNKSTIVECEMSENQTDIFFNFNNTFEIHDDNEILRRMKMHVVSPSEITDFVSPPLLRYLPASVRKKLEISENSSGSTIGNNPSLPPLTDFTTVVDPVSGPSSPALASTSAGAEHDSGSASDKPRGSK